ncbi:MAG: 4-hydroxy-tetrahydrodipicolinate reductase [Muribaculaceae bacterium]|nr:4-hydroxy-tetrahydrodipicolinate reductase [Muribaculaceae bacterium]
MWGPPPPPPAAARGHEITCRIDAGEEALFASTGFLQADAVIEFTRPDAAVGNYRRILAAGKPLVSGTTGWTDRRGEVERLVADTGAAMFWTSNFSIGVFLFNRVCRQAAALMSAYPEYAPSVEETHHVHKLDHPSGTAITLAENILAETPALDGWTEDPRDLPGRLIVSHVRRGEVPGTHTATWESAADEISITHRAKSRDGFALGAVIAAEWLAAERRQGLFSMSDMIP